MGKFNPPVVKKDIDRCHRFGRVGSQQNQPGTSIVHFASRRIRDSVYRSRGKNITSGATSEPKYSSPKTKQNHDRSWRTKREDSKSRKDLNDCWTASGRILVKDRNDKIVQICSDMDKNFYYYCACIHNESFLLHDMFWLY